MSIDLQRHSPGRDTDNPSWRARKRGGHAMTVWLDSPTPEAPEPVIDQYLVNNPHKYDKVYGWQHLQPQERIPDARAALPARAHHRGLSNGPGAGGTHGPEELATWTGRHRRVGDPARRRRPGRQVASGDLRHHRHEARRVPT